MIEIALRGAEQRVLRIGLDRHLMLVAQGA